MNIFIVFFSIFLVVRGNPVESSDERLKSVASDLLNRVGSITDSIKESRDAIAAAPEKLKDQITNFSNFKVSNEQEILKSLEEINNNPAFQGFGHCHKFFERKVQKLKDALAKNITEFIAVQLRNHEISLNNLEQEIAKFSANLLGKNLDKEIILCKNSDSNNCNLTGMYETEIDHSEKTIRNLKNIMNVIVEFIYQNHIERHDILFEESKKVTNFLNYSGCVENPAEP